MRIICNARKDIMKELTLHVRGTKELITRLRREARRKRLTFSELVREKLETSEEHEAKVRKVGNKLFIEVETKPERRRTGAAT